VKTSFPIFLAVFIALGASFGGFVIAPISQLGTEKQTTVLNSSDTYPIQRTGAAALGLQVYRANGCAACHTTQIRQESVACEISLASFGKNHPEEFKKFIVSLLELPGIQTYSNTVAAQLREWNGAVPKTIFPALDKETADKIANYINSSGCKAEIHITATGADILRGWGVRRSVATDFLWDYPVQLGNLRAGPDLANVGARLGNANWQLQHLYAPRSVTQNSVMPPFRFFFEIHKMNGAPSPDALPLSKGIAPDGYEVIPTDDAKNLAAYLLSLRADAPLYEAPFTPEQASTNSAAEKK
jgi:cbb3-type cytochrome oxidase cytochrome c subunit